MSVYQNVPGYCRLGLHELTPENIWLHPAKGWKMCLACKRANQRREYEKSQARRVAYGLAWRAQPEKKALVSAQKRGVYIQVQEAILLAKQGKMCLDCGGSFPSEGMDFDHVRGEKKFNVGQAKSVRALMAELAKCELVCAVCHRTRTKQRRSVL